VLHLPEKEKSVDFQKAFQRKRDQKDFNFRGVWFPDELDFSRFDFTANADFSYATFTDRVDFSYATFSMRAEFSDAAFSGVAYFRSATFRANANFRSSTFGAMAYFNSATFSAEVYFRSATFSATAYFHDAAFSATAYFQNAAFSSAAYFRSATFADHVRFAGDMGRSVFPDTSSLDLQFVRIEKPDYVSFHTLTLRLHWFVNVDARKFNFTNVDWGWRSPNMVIREELESLKVKDVSSPNRMLAIACRQLAVNAEENNRYEEASRFRFMSMDALRREKLLGFAPWRLSWWYWLASGYGERVLKAFLVLLGIWLVFGLFYTQTGFARREPKLASESDIANATRDEIGTPLGFSRALTYSAGVMTLQKPEPRPVTHAAQTVVLLETILGPVQAALLALAIRRKFMR
jgi:pentapeptide repeat protein